MATVPSFDPAAITVADELLTTTRAVRKRLDLEHDVDDALLREALAAARQAPSGGAEEPLRWLVVKDPGTRAAVGELYQAAYAELDRARPAPSGEAAGQLTKVRQSSAHLAQVMGKVPRIIVVCSTAPAPQAAVGAEAAKFYGSVYPAVWSFQLAARARGLGTCLTTIGLRRSGELAGVLGLPDDWTLCALLPVARITGTTLGAAPRRNGEEVVRWI
ncbi:nitroreductase family protein [Nocardioides sp. zg-1228]|uniref:nitroreductase family protein n=1 Tax=Nocardioides sp. zg-1228 TaxID=2763008 RepID=UPI0016433270|nr:nitroreductase family protein [Nocardioides sp. zg-1228]MBC2932094.1 nitroreductase family protein [Nocardioides sp. zg-1228]QSF57642.1 nitroreductase family protein [Nocardioides sp. zg-1228]